MRKVRNFLTNDSGIGQVEFALSILPVLVTVLMTVEIVSAAHTFVVLSGAANEGVRYAIVRSSDNSLAADTTTVVQKYAALSLHNTSNISVSVQTPDGQKVPGRVEVNVSYAYIPWIHFMTNPPTMTAYAEGRLVY
jgi:Flp pilus assembly protein TadG